MAKQSNEKLDKPKKGKGTRKIRRECVVCGKRIYVTVYEDGYYRGGHFFGKIGLPIEGTGEYKKVGTSKILGDKIDVVEWTGKEKKMEYWECNACYEQSMHECWLSEKIEALYGKRCPDYEKDCPSCQAWSVYDTIKEARGILKGSRFNSKRFFEQKQEDKELEK